MACEYINPLHLRNAIDNKEALFLPSEVLDDPQQGMADRISSVDKYITLTADQKNYIIVGHPDKHLQRSTTVVKSKSKQKKGLENKDESVQARGGTFIHLALQFLADNKYNPESLTQAKREEYKSKFDQYKFSLPDAMPPLEKFFNKELVPRIQAVQNKIDPNGKFKILTEQAVLDPVTKVVSRTDLIVIFSDGSVGKIDFKTTTARPEYTDPKTGRIINSGFMLANRAYYRDQALLSKNILQKFYHANVVMDLVVPIHVGYESEKQGNKSVLVEKFKFIESNADYSLTEGKFLNPLVVGKQLTGDPKIDAYIIRQTETLKTLTNALASGKLTPEVRQRYNARIAQIENVISELSVSGEEKDLAAVFNYANSLLMEFQLTSHEMTSRRIKDMKDEVDVLLEIPQVLGSYIESYYKTEEQKRQINMQLGEFTNKLSDLSAKLEAEGLAYTTANLIDAYYKNSDGTLRNYLEDTFMNSATNTAREFNSPFIVALKQGHDLRVVNPVNKKMQEIQKKILELNKNLASAGISNARLKELLINPETKSLYTKLTKEFYERMKEAFATRSKETIDFILNNYEITPENMELLKKQKESIDSKFQAALAQETDAIKKANLKKELDKALEREYLLDEKGNINPNALHATGNRKFLTLKKSSEENNLSKEYKEIKKTPAAAAWYDFYYDLNLDIRKMTGYLEGQTIPSNFFPWIRKTTLERLQEQGALKGSVNSIKQFYESLNYRADDVHMGITDEDFGKEVPFYFTTPFYEGEEIDDSDRSYDFGMTALLYAQMAYTYKYTKDYESDALLLKQVMMNQSNRFVIPANNLGKPKLDVFGDIAYTPTLPSSFEAQAFNDFMDRYIYGITINQKDVITRTIAGKERNITQSLLQLKDVSTRLQLSFAMIGATASYANARLNLKFQSKKSIFFTQEHTTNTEKILTGLGDPQKKKNLIAAIEFFLPHTETFVESNLFNASSRGKLSKIVNDRMAFYGYRKGSEIIDDVITGNVLQNYGWDTETKRIVRLNKPGLEKTYTPLFDLMEFDGENLKFKEIPEEHLDKLQVDIRAAIREISKSIKGEMTSDDIAWYQQRLLGKLLSQYRTWMPAILKERFGALKYKTATDSVQWGRWRSMANDFQYTKDTGMLFYMKSVVLPRIGQIAVDVATMGYLSSDIKGEKKSKSLNLFSRYNEEALRNQYDSIIEKNPFLDKISFEEFKEIKVAQFRAAMVELRVLLGLAALVLLAGMHADDDDEFSYRENQATRVAFKIVSKLQQEMMFTLDPTEGGYLFQNPLPMLGMVLRAKRAISNGIDETTDLIFGEDSPRDKTPFLYYSSGFVMGLIQLRKVFEIFEQDKAVSGYTR